MLPVSPTLFRVLNVLSLVLVIVGSAVDPYFMRSVHVAHSGFAASTHITLFAVVGVIGMALEIASTVGLCLFRAWARPMALAGFATAFVLYPMCTYFAVSGVTTAINFAATSAGGAVLALMYFSPIAQRFVPVRSLDVGAH